MQFYEGKKERRLPKQKSLTNIVSSPRIQGAKNDITQSKTPRIINVTKSWHSPKNRNLGIMGREETNFGIVSETLISIGFYLGRRKPAMAHGNYQNIDSSFGLARIGSCDIVCFGQL